MNFQLRAAAGASASRNSARGLVAVQELVLHRGALVPVPRRDGHAVDAERRHVVEEPVQVGRVVSDEDGRVRRDPEPTPLGNPDGLDRGAVDAGALDGRVVALLDPVEVDVQGEGGARGEEVELALEQDGVRAEVDELAALDQARRDAIDGRVDERLASGDADDGRAALLGGGPALFGERCFWRMLSGCWILPHPVHSRLQRNSGSSISTSGYRFRRRSFCSRMYLPTTRACFSGMPKRRSSSTAG